MNLNEYQQQAKLNSKAPLYGDERDLVVMGLGIAGETGEVCNDLKKLFRDHDSEVTDEWRARVCLELGDVLWYVSQIADVVGLPLENGPLLGLVAERNIEKIKAAKVVRGMAE